ncbi:glycosyltransferase [Algibacter mikhailovii]|uniref:glycosyltransferase n=1 Tax=Algibacter mikhailovii TaxID=425498 RepID=UPI002494B9D9|nr:glycosyltransferase [Algibacter mikhailovii]
MSSKPNLSVFNISLASGGAEKVISLLLKELKHDYNVHLILMYNNVHFQIPKEVNVVFLTNKDTNRPFFAKILDAFLFLLKYYKFLKINNIDYAVSFLPFPNLINGIVSIFNKKAVTIISERGFPSDPTTSKSGLLISKLFYPLLYNKCSKLFSNSIHINKDLKDNFGIKIPMEVIYNPIEAPIKTVASSSLNNKKTYLKVITTGSLNSNKNQIMIFKAIENSNNNLTVLGDGPLKKYLSNQIIELSLEKQVCLKGRVQNVNEQLLKKDCFVLSSFSEGFPNALLEAMAIGLPCIATNCLSGPLELLNNNKPIKIDKGDFFTASFGILINVDDHIGLNKALNYFNQNPSEREKYGKLALERSKNYLLKNVYNQFNHFLKN